MMNRPDPNSLRLAPVIRDHETIRQIGRGAFGEVWLAKSATGVLRAVKVVWREDYDHEESFEREFEALKRYEPISRKHLGLLPILQVGRNEEAGFYYYVMELADDLEQGREIDPATYKPHTLGLQMRRDKRLKVTECIALGSNVAEALGYLHRKKLIHRDVKPSNLIFLDGQWRLADIGLVALLGQRSYVGTEGFVAPEGPGTAASDMFSLGMVLYEAATGKDRLDFPDLPSASGSGEKLELWRRLNQVICKACATKASKRYESADEMALALRGEMLPSARRTMFWTAGIGALAVAVVFGMWLASSNRGRALRSVEVGPAMVKILSEPPGAEVFSGESLLGVTPLELTPPQGLPVLYQLRMAGHKRLEIEHLPSEDGDDAEYHLKLESSRLPQIGELWKNSLAMEFKPRGGGHASMTPVQMSVFREFLGEQRRPFEGRVVRFLQGTDREQIYIVVVPVADAEAFRFWLTDRDRSAGYLSQEHFYEVEPFYFVENATATEDMPDMPGNGAEETGKDWQAFYLRVSKQTYGTVVVRSAPEGVKVYQNEQLLGETPLELPRVRSGAVEYELREEGFTDLVLEGEVKEADYLELFADMDAKKGVKFGREWKNTLGMKFVPLGDVLMSVWETRRRDYLEFTKETGGKRPGGGEGIETKSATQPVMNISREEARAFCAWLTDRERTSGLIGPGDAYRLPTDEEWSRAAGLPLERGADPAQRSGRIRGIYPWGFEWPPPSHYDNFADVTAVQRAGADSAIPGYDDRFSFTAPVTALQQNENGLIGLAGNVSEWVDTDFDLKAEVSETTGSANGVGTVRGGNWRSHSQEELLASTRLALAAEARRNTVGFRVILSRAPAVSQVGR
jgi:formylglycine-generating enzyme required for sulfatase activity